MHIALLAPEGVDLQLVVLQVFEDIPDILAHWGRHSPFGLLLTFIETVVGCHAR